MCSAREREREREREKERERCLESVQTSSIPSRQLPVGRLGYCINWLYLWQTAPGGRFGTSLGMCLLAKSVLTFAIYNISKPCFGPFVSDIGNWFKYPHFCTCKTWLEGAGGLDAV